MPALLIMEAFTQRSIFTAIKLLFPTWFLFNEYLLSNYYGSTFWSHIEPFELRFASLTPLRTFGAILNPVDSLSDGATRQCFPTRQAGNLVIKERAIDHAYHHTQAYILRFGFCISTFWKEQHYQKELAFRIRTNSEHESSLVTNLFDFESFV